MRFLPFLALLAVLSAACTSSGSAETTTTLAPSTTTTTEASDTPACLSGELPFVEEGTVAALDSQGRDARAIAGVRWDPFEGCERVEIEFLSATGAPATRIGPVGISMLADSGIVRVNLSDAIVESAVADSTLNGTLVDKWFVVEDSEDGLTVDLHLNERAAARAFTTTSPRGLSSTSAEPATIARLRPRSPSEGSSFSVPRPASVSTRCRSTDMPRPRSTL